MRAIVLSGGGAKGAYQLGFFKAIRKLGIKYDIVTGTSIGALNGLLFAQKEYFKCFKLWNNIDFKQIYDDFDSTNVYKSYIGKITEGGIDTSKIETIINTVYNPNKLYNSNIKYGVVSVNLKTRKEKFSTTLNTKPDKLPKYILASATCFPVFKPANIDNELYIDGGFYDNLPINLAVDLGAKDIIAVDLKAIGFRKKIENENINLIYIAPNNKLDSFLNFEKNSAKKMMKLGYNDTMKVFKKLEGKSYTFKLGSLHNNYKKYGNKFKEIIATSFNEKINEGTMNRVLENALEMFEIDATKIYNKEFNDILLTALNNTDEIVNNFEVKEIKKLFKKKTIVKLIYMKLKNKEDCTIYKIFKKEFLVALYLIVIGG